MTREPLTVCLRGCHRDELRAEIEQLTGAKAALQVEIERLRDLNDSMGEDAQRFLNHLMHAAGFVEGMAGRIERWARWDSGEGDVESFKQAARDLRDYAKSLQIVRERK